MDITTKCFSCQWNVTGPSGTQVTCPYCRGSVWIPRHATRKEAQSIVSVERAKLILNEIKTSHGWGSKSMTEEEHNAITAYWETLPGETTFFDAVNDLTRE